MISEARSLIYNLEYREPILYNGEIEDSNQNYFTIRLADHVQFYTFNNKTDKARAVTSLGSQHFDTLFDEERSHVTASAWKIHFAQF